MPEKAMKIEEMIEKYSELVYKLAFSRTRNIEESEDIYQNVFLKLSQKIKKLENEEHLKSWLIRVTINETNNIFKSAYYRHKAELKDNLKVKTEENIEILEEIFKLEKNERTIIYLHYYEGYKISEIAKILSITESSAKTRLYRARNKLRGSP